MVSSLDSPRSSLAPRSVVNAATRIHEYFYRLLRQQSLNQQMVVEFDNPGSPDYATNQQAFNYLLGRPVECRASASATDVWKCLAVLNSNYGFSFLVKRNYFSCVKPMRDLLAACDDPEEFRAEMLKISIVTVQREFEAVLGLSISSRFALLLCGYPCHNHTHLIPEPLRLKDHGTDPPPYLEIRRRFSLAVDAYVDRTNGSSLQGRARCLTSEDAIKWTCVGVNAPPPSPHTEGAAPSPIVLPRYDPTIIEKPVPKALLNTNTFLETTIGCDPERIDYTAMPPLLRKCVGYEGDFYSIYVCERPFDLEDNFPGFVTEAECVETGPNVVASFRRLLSKSFLDVAAGVTQPTTENCGDSYNPNVDDQVQIIHLDHSNNNVGANVFTLRDPFSDKFVTDIIQGQDNLLYLRSDEIGSSARGKTKF